MFKTKEEKPYCYLLDNKNSKIEKLKLIQKLFGTGRAIAILSHIQSFIQQLKADNNLSFEEKKILSEFTRNKKLKSELLSLLRLAGDIYLPLKIDVLSTLKHLELISAPLAATSMKQILKLQEPFTEARKNIYCSVADKITLAVEEVPQQRWEDVNFIAAMICLKSKESAFNKKMALVIETSVTANVRASAIWYFYSVITSDLSIQLQIARAMRDDPENFVRQIAAVVLQQLKPNHSEVRALIVDAFIKENDPHIKKIIEGLLR